MLVGGRTHGRIVSPMPRESGLLNQEVAILIWLAAFAHAAIWWFVEDRICEALYRQSEGSHRTGGRILNDLVRRPRSLPSIAARNWSARMKARFAPAGEPELERQRRKALLGYVTALVVIFLGLPMSLRSVAFVRDVLPGTVVLWAAAADLIVLAAWARRGVHARSHQDPQRLRFTASVAGVAICVISLAVLVKLWISGGIAV
jgi:hypothetical protein